jgi:hypothetical protein
MELQKICLLDPDPMKNADQEPDLAVGKFVPYENQKPRLFFKQIITKIDTDRRQRSIFWAENYIYSPSLLKK